MELWLILAAVSLAFTITALAPAYYALVLFLSALKYPNHLGKEEASLIRFPRVSILIAAYNEKFVISRTLEAITRLDYPKEKIQVVVADDSTDETREIIDQELHALDSLGMATVASRRKSREGFKRAALNHAAPLLEGEYVLLLDADSVVSPEVLKRGLAIFEKRTDVAFVSFRVGHYNREQNLITRLFALSLDLGDTLNKMGSYSINSPFSFQGGFTLVSTEAVKEVGFWSQDTIVEDADLSCRIYASGRRGVYLSNVKVLSEDPSVLEIWKKQAARVAQGWTKCIKTNWRMILSTPKLSYWRRIGLLLMLANPFSALSWLVVTFVSGVTIILRLSPPDGPVFSNPAYLVFISLPATSYFASAMYSLHLQRILTARNLLLVPLISYTGYAMLTAVSVGFLSGIVGRTGFFFRTPKSGPNYELSKTHYFGGIRLDKVAIVEGLLAAIAIVLGVFVVFSGVWFLGLSLLGFGILTLKSMNLSRLIRRNTFHSDEGQVQSGSYNR